jgi:hypothetical protein
MTANNHKPSETGRRSGCCLQRLVGHLISHFFYIPYPFNSHDTVQGTLTHPICEEFPFLKGLELRSRFDLKNDLSVSSVLVVSVAVKIGGGRVEFRESSKELALLFVQAITGPYLFNRLKIDLGRPFHSIHPRNL